MDWSLPFLFKWWAQSHRITHSAAGRHTIILKSREENDNYNLNICIRYPQLFAIYLSLPIFHSIQTPHSALSKPSNQPLLICHDPSHPRSLSSSWFDGRPTHD
ncbi:hypothetical protein FPOAC2_04416 [Fusarium poae]